jgi:hypothetical protein
MTLNCKFTLGQGVWLVHDPEQSQWMVTAVTWRGKTPLYELTCGMSVTSAAEFELSSEENIAMKVTS